MVRRRILRFMVSSLLRISSLLMRNPSLLCPRQSAATSSFSMAVSPAETAGQNLLDAMDLRGHIARRDAGNLGDARGVGSFEVEKDHLPLDRLELLDEFAQPLQRLLLIERVAGIGSNRQIVNVVETDQRTIAGALMPDHMRRGHVVRDAIHPRTQRATAGEPFEAAPDGEVNV